MAAKTIFFVLLSAALVLGNPTVNENIQTESQSVVNQLADRSIEDVWRNVKNKLSGALEAVKTKLKKVKHEGSEVLDNLKPKNIGKKILELFNKAKNLTNKILHGNKSVTTESKEVKQNLDQLFEELKKNGTDALTIGALLVEGVVEEIKVKLDALQKTQVQSKTEKKN